MRDQIVVRLARLRTLAERHAFCVKMNTLLSQSAIVRVSGCGVAVQWQALSEDRLKNTPPRSPIPRRSALGEGETSQEVVFRPIPEFDGMPKHRMADDPYGYFFPGE